MYLRFVSILAMCILTLAFVAPPASAQTTPTLTVQAVMFWIDGCPHCHDVLDNVLPPLQAKYGSQLEILLVEVITTSHVEQLYDIAASYYLPQSQVGAPFLIIGEHVLVGSDQISRELEGLIESYLSSGGVGLPEIPGLENFSSQILFSATIKNAPVETVHIVLFSTPDCHECQLVSGEVQELVQQAYDEQVAIEVIDTVTSEDVKYLYRVAAAFGLSRDEVDLPLLIIGDQVLIDEEINANLPALIEMYLRKGGVDRPQLPAEQATGFTLAIVVMAVMSLVLIYSIIAFTSGKTFLLPNWAEWLIPGLIMIGIGVAGYLTYVETQNAVAVCGPVGDCNAVQQSRYARLFGVLPIGVVGLIGYVALFISWLTGRFNARLQKPAVVGFFGMAFIAVLFSLYLTYLEPFVIHAVCIWCLISAVIVTILLLLGTSSAVRQLTLSYKDE